MKSYLLPAALLTLSATATATATAIATAAAHAGVLSMICN